MFWHMLGAARGAAELTGTGLHAPRHFYASLLIRYGESMKVMQTGLGLGTAAEPLDICRHLWPDSDDQTRQAEDSVLFASSADSRQTGRLTDKKSVVR
jgi:hypothetical protein